MSWGSGREGAGEPFVSFYDFPIEHWVRLRTTNSLELVFSVVRLRED